MTDRVISQKVRTYFWGGAYLLFVTGFLFFLFNHWAYDDPYITYRYAQNLTSGVGFVYNPGEYVQSTTTPLFTILLASLSATRLEIPIIANFVSAFSLGLGAIFIWDLAKSWATPAIGWAGLLLYPTFPLLLSTTGSETPLYLAFCLGAFAFYARQNWILTAILSAFALLTRPDGILVPLLLASDYIIRVCKPVPWKGVIIFLVLTLPWFLFAWSYFGSPVPVTLAAKQSQGSMAISQRFAPGFLTIIHPYAERWNYVIEGLLALTGAVGLLIGARISSYTRRWLFFLSWPMLYFIAYSILGVSRYFWYYAPLVPGWIILIGYGTHSLSRSALRAWDTIRHPSEPNNTAAEDEHELGWISRPVVPAITITLLGLLACIQCVDLFELRDQVDPRVEIYRHAGIWLQQNTPTDARVGALEVGIIGYYAQRPMIDFAGLIQPQVASQLTADVTYQDAARWAVENLRPQYLVLQEGAFPGIQESFVEQYCQVVKRFPGEKYGFPSNLDIFKCK